MNAYAVDDAAVSPPDVVVAQLSDEDLIEWVRRSLHATGISPRFTVRRRRWWRVHLAATRELGDRLVLHAGTPGTCEICHASTATTHIIGGDHNAPVFAHYCRECAENAPPGWYSYVTS